MADALTTALQLVLSARDVKDTDLTDAIDQLTLDKGDTLAAGTSTDQADVIFHDTRSLAATSEDLDLAGTLLDTYGNTATFATIKGLLIHNKNTTTAHTLAIGGAAASTMDNIFASTTDILNIGPNGLLLLWNPTDGYDVTSATADLLKIDGGANTVTYDIVVIGTSA